MKTKTVITRLCFCMVTILILQGCLNSKKKISCSNSDYNPLQGKWTVVKEKLELVKEQDESQQDFIFEPDGKVIHRGIRNDEIIWKKEGQYCFTDASSHGYSENSGALSLFYKHVSFHENQHGNWVKKPEKDRLILVLDVNEDPATYFLKNSSR